MMRRPPRSTLFPDTTLSRSAQTVYGDLDVTEIARPPRDRKPVETAWVDAARSSAAYTRLRSEEHTSELQSRQYLVCRLLLEKKKKRHWVRWFPHRSNSARSR